MDLRYIASMIGFFGFFVFLLVALGGLVLWLVGYVRHHRRLRTWGVWLLAAGIALSFGAFGLCAATFRLHH